MGELEGLEGGGVRADISFGEGWKKKRVMVGRRRSEDCNDEE